MYDLTQADRRSPCYFNTPSLDCLVAAWRAAKQLARLARQTGKFNTRLR
jgi:hypothetical protein